MVIKRNGQKVEFEKNKIREAVKKAWIEVKNGINNKGNSICDYVADKIETEYRELKDEISVEEIQNRVEDLLMDSGEKQVARAYIRYRYKRELVRESNTTDKDIKELLEGNSDYWNTENSNKNAKIVTVQRDYIAGITSTDIARRFIFPKDVIKAHDKGIIHKHDMDYMAQRTLTNCCLINLEDMLQNGTVINGVSIEKPHRLLTATTICTQIITAVSSSQYGGCTITLTHLAPFVRDSYNYYIEKYKKRNLSYEQVLQFAQEDLEKEIQDAVQTFNYQINSMTNTNGQAPFITVFMYLSENPEYTKEIAMLIKEFLLQRIKGMKDETGHYVTQAFPKLIYCLEKKNITEDSEYWWLTKLAAQCTAKRMVPDYISEKVMLEQKIDKNGKGNVYPCMGCRSFLTPFIDNFGNPKYYGRYNCGVCTISLPYIALMSNGNFEKFWEELDKYTELCHKALKISVDRIKETSVNVAPILWKYGAFGRLNSDQKIGDLMFGGYATVSLGYAGLYECVKYMTGHSHFDNGVGKEFGIKVMKFLNEKCNKWKENENISYSLYGTPLEATTYKLAKALKRDFGEIKGITDRNYITNSYHIPVFEEINPFEKLKIESEFQKLSPGGMISYCESANLSHNIEAVLQILQFMYENIMYAELNIKSDYCQACGNEVEMKIIDKNGTLDWQCPICGNKDHDKMRVSRRTCGYIGNNYWNQGRTQEIKERYVHIDNHLYKEEQEK